MLQHIPPHGKGQFILPTSPKSIKDPKSRSTSLKLGIYRLNKADMYMWSRHPCLLFWVKQTKTKQNNPQMLWEHCKTSKLWYFSNSIKWSDTTYCLLPINLALMWVSDTVGMMCGELDWMRLCGAEKHSYWWILVAPNSLQAVWEEHSPPWFPWQLQHNPRKKQDLTLLNILGLILHCLAAELVFYSNLKLDRPIYMVSVVLRERVLF